MTDEQSRPESHIDTHEPDYTSDKKYALLFACTYSASHQASTLTHMADILSANFNMVNIPADQLCKQTGRTSLESSILDKISEFDIFLLHSGKPLFDFSFYRKLKEKNPKLVIGYVDGDAHMNLPIYTGLFVKDIDLFISVDSIDASDYIAQMGCRSICLGNFVNKQDFFPVKNVEKDINVSFYGGLKGDRTQFLSRLKKENVGLQCFGQDERITPQELNKVINRSKIGLSLNKCGYSPKKIRYPKKFILSRSIKAHIFEYILCHSFVLSEHIDNMDRFFIPDKELVSFEGANDLVDKVRYYLEHEQEREDIADAAYQKTMKLFEGSIQIQKMANLIKKVTNEKRGFKETYSDENLSYTIKPMSAQGVYKPTKKYFVNFHAGQVHRFLKYKKYKTALKELGFLKYGIPYLYLRSKIYYSVRGFLGNLRLKVRNYFGYKNIQTKEV